MHLTAVAALFPTLGEPELTAWVDRGWVHPEPGPVFHDIDIARIRLIHDLRVLMLIEDETIPLILSLLDQVYDVRGKLRTVLRAVEAQPEPVRRSILSAIG
ncbi:MAG: hypothetical protein EXR07_16120 [Acetobacteraceae bacterium]|nr:hypothetical protein [Acetobacteraceae bacterium]